MATPDLNNMTVDQAIVELQKLSWTGKGKYVLMTDSANGESRFYTRNDFKAEPEQQRINLNPTGAYL